MAERKFYLWQVRSFTVRIDLELIVRLNASLAERRDESTIEFGGILLGRSLVPNEIEISGVEFVPSEHRRGIIYSLGLREQLSMAERVGHLSRKSEPRPVGFFRTHLRKGLYLDQDDFSLMQEAFGDPSQVALLIRPIEPGPPNAGIFLWEDGDIDRRQTELLFPFDSETLCAQGPIESIAPPAPRTPRAPLRMPVIPLRWTAWGAVTAAGALALGAVLPKLHVRQQQPDTKPPAITVQADLIEPGSPAPKPVQAAAVVAEEKPSPIPFIAPTPDERPSVTLPVPKPPEEQPKQVATVLPPPPLPVPTVAAKALDPIPEPVLPTPPPPEPVRPVVRKPAVHIAVSLEARQSSELKKVVGHVPLFGRLAHAEGGSDFSPARPGTPLEPRVPADLASDLSGELAVDVRVSIDKHGLVTNSEVLQGAGTQLASLAANSVERASWQPAHEGDRNVNSEMIVHYRFQSGQ